jgi:hypothetical protein
MSRSMKIGAHRIIPLAVFSGLSASGEDDRYRTARDLKEAQRRFKADFGFDVNDKDKVDQVIIDALRHTGRDKLVPIPRPVVRALTLRDGFGKRGRGGQARARRRLLLMNIVTTVKHLLEERKRKAPRRWRTKQGRTAITRQCVAAVLAQYPDWGVTVDEVLTPDIWHYRRR